MCSSNVCLGAVSKNDFTKRYESERGATDAFQMFYREKKRISKTMYGDAVVSSKKTLAAVMVLMVIGSAVADMADVGMCIRNCAQCKKMLGAYFEGPLCADACVKFKGKMIPDCENIDSVAPFLNKLE